MKFANAKVMTFVLGLVFAGGLLAVVVNATNGSLSFGSGDISLDSSLVVQDQDAEAGSFVQFAASPVPEPTATPAPTQTPTEEPTPEPTPTPPPNINDGLHAYCSANTLAASVGAAAVPSTASFTKLATMNVGGFANIEGPVVADGELYVSRLGQSLTGGELYRLDGSVLTKIADISAGVNGMAFSHTLNTVLGARHADGSISELDIGGNSVILIPRVSQYNGSRFNSPNDIAVLDDGTIVFTDPSWQTASPTQSAERAYIAVDGAAPQAVPAGPSRPNGVVINAAGDQLYIGGTNGVYRYNFSGNTASSPSKVVNGSHTDGMTADCYGNVYFTVDKTVQVYSTTESKVIRTYQVPDGLTGANLAFMGSDLILTTFGTNPSIYKMAMTNANFVGFPN